MRNADASDPGVGPSVPRGAPPTSNPLRHGSLLHPRPPNSCSSRNHGPPHPGLGLLPLTFYLMVASCHLRGGLCPSHTGTPRKELGATLPHVRAPETLRFPDMGTSWWFLDHFRFGNH